MSALGERAVFRDAVQILLGEEAGWNNDPVDRGKETNRGITQPTLDEAIRLGIVPGTTTVRTVTAAQAMAIYEALYWKASHCDELPAALALQVFDWSVISGPGRALRGLQQALGVEADGAWGPRTSNAADTAGDRALVALTKIRLDFHDEDIRKHPPQVRFRDGWRLRALRTLVTAARA